MEVNSTFTKVEVIWYAFLDSNTTTPSSMGYPLSIATRIDQIERTSADGQWSKSLNVAN